MLRIDIEIQVIQGTPVGELVNIRLKDHTVNSICDIRLSLSSSNSFYVTLQLSELNELKVEKMARPPFMHRKRYKLSLYKQYFAVKGRTKFKPQNRLALKISPITIK